MSDRIQVTDDPKTRAARPPWYRRRWLLGLMAALSIPLGLAGIGLLVITDIASKTERAAVAEANRVDPGWRLDDLEAARAVVADAENAALVVNRAYVSMIPGRPFPRSRPRAPAVPLPSGGTNALLDAQLALSPSATRVDGLPLTKRNAFQDSLAVPPATALDPSLSEELAGDLEAYAPALGIARGLAGMHAGRYPSGPRAFKFWTTPPQVDEARSVARLMVADAILQADRGDGDAAILACRAALGASASSGDEPNMMAALIRVSLDALAVQAVQRALAQGTASDAALALLDADLAAEDAQPLLKIALRGDRAVEYETLGRIAAGTPPVALGLFPPGMFGGWGMKGPHIRAWFRYNQGRSLARVTAALAIAELPSHEQPPRWAEWQGEFLPNPRRGSLTLLVEAPSRLVMSSGPSLAPAFQRGQAQLRAARVMVAMERFRLAHGRWPETDAELAIPGGMPRDPFLDAPIRRKRTAEGWAIYSVGDDRVDDGGTFDSRRAANLTRDVGVALYDPDRRRRPAEPKPQP